MLCSDSCKILIITGSIIEKLRFRSAKYSGNSVIFTKKPPYSRTSTFLEFVPKIDFVCSYLMLAKKLLSFFCRSKVFDRRVQLRENFFKWFCWIRCMSTRILINNVSISRKYLYWIFHDVTGYGIMNFSITFSIL